MTLEHKMSKLARLTEIQTAELEHLGIHQEHTAVARRTALSQGSTLSALFDSVGEWRERMRQRRQLMKLDDRLLADIGLSRADAEAECGKMWRR